MAVADIPAEQIVNIRSSYDQFLWQISPLLDLYRWDKNVGYMYAYGAIPVPGQGLPPGPPVPNPDAPFNLGELEYLNDFYIRSINGMTPDINGNVEIVTGIDQAARDAAAAAQGTADRAVPASAAANGQVFVRNGDGALAGLPYSDIGRRILAAADAGDVRSNILEAVYRGTSVTGTGSLAGGGDLSADRTLDLSAAAKTSLGKANTAVQPTRAINPGTGLSGGGDLSTDRTISLSTATQSSLSKADSASQPGHTHTASQISDATAVGRSVLTATDAAAARTAVGAPSRAETVRTVNGNAPDGNGNVVVSGGGTGTVQKVNNIAPDSNGNVTVPKIIDTAPAIEVPLCIYGDSIAVGSNATSASRGWAALLANANRLAASSYNNYAVSGTVMGDIARAVLTGTMSNATRRGLHIIHSGINSIINVTSANDSAEKTGFVTALKANLRILRGSWLLANDSSIAYTGTWTNKTLANVTHSSPNVKQSDVNGNYFTITTTAAEIAIMLIGFSTASPSDGVPYTITVNGTTYNAEVLTTASTTSPNNPWGPQSVRVVNPSPGSSMAVRLTRGAGASFYMDGYVVKDPNPPAILVCNIIMPTQAGLNVNGSDTNRTPANVTNFNNLIANVVNSAEFSADGQVKLVDISPGFDNSSMRTSEGIHPNNIGHKVIAGNIEAAARALPLSVGLNL